MCLSHRVSESMCVSYRVLESSMDSSVVHSSVENLSDRVSDSSVGFYVCHYEQIRMLESMCV